VRTKTMTLLAVAGGALVCAAAAGGSVPQLPRAQTTGYPWVQPPAQVGTGVVQALPAITSPSGVQPPASIVGVSAPVAAPSTSYPWVQLPAWVGTGTPPAAQPTAGYQWAQPPAWIPTQ
jgi:hypothetical protein